MRKAHIITSLLLVVLFSSCNDDNDDVLELPSNKFTLVSFPLENNNSWIHKEYHEDSTVWSCGEIAEFVDARYFKMVVMGDSTDTDGITGKAVYDYDMTTYSSSDPEFWYVDSVGLFKRDRYDQYLQILPPDPSVAFDEQVDMLMFKYPMEEGMTWEVFSVTDVITVRHRVNKDTVLNVSGIDYKCFEIEEIREVSSYVDLPYQTLNKKIYLSHVGVVKEVKRSVRHSFNPLPSDTTVYSECVKYESFNNTMGEFVMGNAE